MHENKLFQNYDVDENFELYHLKCTLEFEIQAVNSTDKYNQKAEFFLFIHKKISESKFNLRVDNIEYDISKV